MSSACTAASTRSLVGEGRSVAHLGEEVAAEQRAGGLLVEDVGVPAVGHVRGVDAADAPASEVEEPSGAIGTGGRSARSLIDTMQPDRGVGDLGVRARRRGRGSSRRTRRLRDGRT